MADPNDLLIYAPKVFVSLSWPLGDYWVFSNRMERLALHVAMWDFICECAYIISYSLLLYKSTITK